MSAANPTNAEIVKTVNRFYAELSEDPNHRLRSWGHCFAYFQRLRRGDADANRDAACLHLGVYLANCGMYRPRGFLLWKDYCIHRAVVNELLAPAHRGLWRAAVPSYGTEAVWAESVSGLCARIRAGYSNYIAHVNSKKVIRKPTDTLVTKILLGTVGCTPAYDEFVIAGVREVGIKYSKPSPEHFRAICGFYRDHLAAFSELRDSLRERGLRYPPMKLVDMYFWIRGRDE